MVIKAAASANRAKNRLFERHKKNDEINVPGIMLKTPRAKPAVVMPSPLERIDKYQWPFGTAPIGEFIQILVTDSPLNTAFNI